MQSLGIDLSTDPKKVWVCEIDWASESPCVTSLERMADADDPRLPWPGDESRGVRAVRDEGGLAAALTARIARFGPAPGRVVGIDAPLGWPAAFVQAMQSWSSGDAAGFVKRTDLRLRASDRFVQATTGLTPMSVSTDRIGSTAMLCAEVLSALAHGQGRPALDRARAADGVAEVYPAAALRMWTTDDGHALPTSSYKSDPRSREVLLRDVIGLVVPDAPKRAGDNSGDPEWPEWTDPAYLARQVRSSLPLPAEQGPSLGAAGVAISPARCDAMIRSDDALDAFICALVARAVAVDGCFTVDRPVEPQDLFAPLHASLADPDQRREVRVDRARALQSEALAHAEAEGWIHVPVAGAMSAGLAASARAASGAAGAR